MKMNRAAYLLFLILWIPQYGFSQQISKRISHTTVGIYNNTDKKIAFKLGLSNAELRDFEIFAQENWISPTYPIGSKPLFLIKTQDKESKYTLKLNTNYLIYWNNKKKKYDLSKVKTVSD